jgi:hypothetical protein
VLRNEIRELALSFHNLRIRSRIWLLSGLLDNEIDRSTLRVFFAVCRSELNELFGTESAAIYAPLGADGESEQGDFPLHADLYPPSLLLNIFDSVPTDTSGGSIFCNRLLFSSTIANFQRNPGLTSAAGPNTFWRGCCDFYRDSRT